jgi:hypothetical protein
LAISIAVLADSGWLSPTIPSITIDMLSVDPPTGSNNSVMDNESYTLKKVPFTFSTMSTSSYPEYNAEIYKSQVSYTGTATAKDGSSISNVFINMSGLIIHAGKPETRVMGAGLLSGSATRTDKYGTAGKVNFSGAYSQKILMLGWVKNPFGGISPTRLLALPMQVTVSGVYDASSGTQLPMVLTAHVSAMSLTFPKPAPLSGTWDFNYTVENDTGTGDSWSMGDGTFNLPNLGTNITGQVTDINSNNDNISGTIEGKNVTMSFTDVDGNITTLTGPITPDYQINGTFTSTNGDSGTWTAWKQ